MTSVGVWLQRHADLNRLDLEVLLAETLKLNRSQIIAFPEQPIDAAQLKQLCALASRLQRGEPVAYLLGCREFYSLQFKVTPGVLIPRADTELLVDTALEKLADRQGVSVLDLGTGSGAVAISIACNSEAEVVATDLSAEALQVARENAELHQAAVSFLCGDWLTPVERRFSLIVSNPPYIAEHDQHLPDLRFEPQSALISGPEGLNALRHISQQAGDFLEDQGWLMLEHGYDQGDAVRSALSIAGFNHICTRKDFGGNERVTMGRWDATP